MTLHYHKPLTPYVSPRGESQSKFNIPSATSEGARRGAAQTEAEVVFFFFHLFFSVLHFFSEQHELEGGKSVERKNNVPAHLSVPAVQGEPQNGKERFPEG